MINQKQDLFLELKKSISQEKKIVNEIVSFLDNFKDKGDKEGIKSQIKSLEFHIAQENERIPQLIGQVYLTKKLSSPSNNVQRIKAMPKNKITEKAPTRSFLDVFKSRKEAERFGITGIERNIIKRIGSKKVSELRLKEKGPNVYAGISSKMFPELPRTLMSQKFFKSMIQNLLKTNLKFIPTVYIATMLFSTLISIGIGMLIFLFALFFNISPNPPFISFAGNIATRFIETFWIIFVVPIGTFLFMYSYPSLERKSLETGIDQELPFATINMSAIAGSRIEPTNIFSIIISTGEYPNLKTQFTKLINEINLYGYDLVTALRNSVSSCPSKKLADLFDGLATNITSGGNLTDFFEKRSQSLLLDYRLEREKATKSSETFIDIYISIVIAAPMILMLLLVMIQISGLGISLSPTMISVVMIMGVSVINLVFLMFLRVKQPSQ